MKRRVGWARYFAGVDVMPRIYFFVLLLFFFFKKQRRQKAMTGGKWEEGNSLRPQYSQSKFECRQLACQVCERLHSIIHFFFPSRVYQNFDEQQHQLVLLFLACISFVSFHSFACVPFLLVSIAYPNERTKVDWPQTLNFMFDMTYTNGSQSPNSMDVYLLKSFLSILSVIVVGNDKEK